jgi:hypothetical protein
MFLMLLYPEISFGQDSNIVTYKSLGFRFTIPQNWEGKETKGMYLLTSENNEGVVIISSFPFDDINKVRAQFAEGLEIKRGFYLAPAAPIETINNHRIQGKFSGLIDYNPIISYLVLLKGEQQQTVLIVSANEKEKYTKEQEAIAKEIANGFEFFSPEMPSLIDEYQDFLADTRLIYTSDSESNGLESDDPFDNPGFGYREKTTINLCRHGLFSYNNFVSGNGSAAFAAGNNTLTGEWNIIKDSDNNAVLQLQFDDGDTIDYQIEYLEGQVYLNEDQFIRSPLTMIEKEQCN